MSDKTEAATPKRLRRARKDGDIAKSAHMTVAVSGVFWWLFLVVDAPHLYETCVQMARAVIWLDQRQTFEERWLVVSNALAGLLPALTVTLGIAVLSALLPELAQTRGLIAFKRAKPDFKRLNPVSGFKNLFGLKALIDTGITLMQFAILIWVMWSIFRLACGQLLAAFAQSFGGQLSATSQLLAHLLMLTSIALLVPAAIDVLAQRFQWLKRLRMAKHEVKRDHREEEGDPHIKGHRRSIHRELSQ